MTIYSFIQSLFWGVLLFLGLYFNYMLISDDIRHEKKRKAEKRRQELNTTPLRRSR